VVVPLVLPQPNHKIVILNVAQWIVSLVNGLPGECVQSLVVVVHKLVLVKSRHRVLVVVLLVLPQPKHKIVILNVVEWIVSLVDILAGARVQQLVAVALKLVLVLSLPMLLAEVLLVLDLSIHEIVILNVVESIVWSVLGSLLERVLQLVVVVLTLELGLFLYNLRVEVLIALLFRIHSLVIQIAVQ